MSPFDVLATWALKMQDRLKQEATTAWSRPAFSATCLDSSRAGPPGPTGALASRGGERRPA